MRTIIRTRQHITAALLVLFALLVSMGATGQQLKDFTLSNAADGKSVALTDFKSSDGLVIVFMSTDCPFDSYYYNRIASLVTEYGNRVSLILVNPNAGESATAMKQTLGKMGISVPYLMDFDQVLMQNLGATKTPEIFVLKNSGGLFTTIYHGAIDNNAQVESEASESYGRNAIDAMLSGQSPAQKEMRPAGCSIRKKDR